MSLSTTDSRFVYDGDGATTEFSYPRKVIEAAHLDVWLYDEDDNSFTLQTLNSHYTFAGSGLSNGIYASATITFTSAPGSDKKVVIYRDPTLTQEADFTGETNVLNALNRLADRVEMKFQRMQDQISRAVRLADGDYNAALAQSDAALTGKSGYLFAVNGDGDGVTLVANNGSSNLVTATGSTEARTLADRFAEVFRPEDFGAVGDGTTDDTTAFQACLDAIGEGDCVVLVPGAVYSVTNLTLPSNSAAGTSGKRNGLICVGGMATIKCRAGGDTDYLVATDRWLTGNANKAYGGTPWHAENIVFDANSIAAKAVVSKNFWSRWESCYFQGSTETDFEFTRQNQDSTDGTNGLYLGDTVWNDCRFMGAGTYQFRSRGTNSDESDANTDNTINDCSFSGAADYGLYLENLAGWMITNNRTYSQTVAGAYFGRLSRGHTISNNNFDGTACIVGQVGSYPDGVIGPGNCYYVDLIVNFKADTSAERIKVFGEHFYANQARTVKAKVVHNYSHANKVLRIESCTFDADPVYARGSGVTAGTVNVRRCTSASATGAARDIAYLRDVGGVVDDGYQEFTTNGTWTKPEGCTKVAVEVVGAGGGGGGGARVTSGNACSGGGGGGGGGRQFAMYDAAALAATVAVTVGTPGAGAAGATSDNTAGSNGSAGTASRFDSFGTPTCLIAYGGGGGAGGQLAGNSGGGGAAGVASAGASSTGATGGTAGTGGGSGGSGAVGGVGVNGGSGGGGCANASAGSNGGTSGVGGAGGGGGGGISAVPVAGAGGNGGGLAGYSGPTGGAATGAAGTAGTAQLHHTGTGGSGGGGNTSGAGGAGGAGAYGAGGGGGGSGIGGDGGAGGDGGSGIVRVWSFFG